MNSPQKPVIMKQTFFYFLVFLSFLQSNAQIGIGTSSPNSSSILDITSNTKGVLFPRLFSSERLKIQTPAEGLMVFDLDSSSLFIYTTAHWLKIQTATAAKSFNIEYPDGLNNFVPILKDISSNKSYQVPVGKNLYIQATQTPFKINNDTFPDYYHSRFIVKSNDVISGLDPNSFISGFLIDSTIAPIIINLSVTNFVVPFNRLFVLFASEAVNTIDPFMNHSNLKANGISLNPNGLSKWDFSPLIFESGTILSGTCTINGYLK